MSDNVGDNDDDGDDGEFNKKGKICTWNLDHESSDRVARFQEMSRIPLSPYIGNMLRSLPSLVMHSGLLAEQL